MKKALLSLFVASVLVLPQTVYAQWDWWGKGKNQQKKEEKQEKKELKAINKEAKKELKEESRLQPTMNPEMANKLREKTDAFQKRQIEMSKEFQESMKGMNAEQRAKALADYREKQYKDSVAFSDDMHQENVKALQERLDKDPKMTAERKSSIVANVEKQYKDMAVLREKHHTENVAFFNKLDQDQKMTPEKKQEAIREHFMTQQEAYKNLRPQINAEKKEMKEVGKEIKKDLKEVKKEMKKKAEKPSAGPAKAETPKK